MSFLPQRYFSNLFVALSIEDGQCHLLAKAIKNGKIQKTYEAAFDNPYSDKLDPKVIEYIKDKANSCLDTYIIYFLDAMGQGVLPTIKASDFESYSVDIKHVRQVKVADSWSIYASYIEINWAQKMFEEVGLDLLYSPFVLMYHYLKKDGFRNKLTLYMYNHQDSFAIGVFKGEKLLFGAFFRTSDGASSDELDDKDFVQQDWDEVEEEKGVENLVQLDEESDEEDYQSLDDLDDLDTMDAVLSDDQDLEQTFDEGPEDIQMIEKSNIDSEKSIELFGRNMLMYKYLKSSIEEFYYNPKYESDFIEDIVIFDNYEMSQTVFDILENELLVRVELQKVKTLELMLELGRKDLGI